jgi:Secretion system C-terminal sorting domain/Beta-galactosidase
MIKRKIFGMQFSCRGVLNTPFYIVLIFLYLFNYQQLIAQDNQRYLTLSLVNIDERSDELNLKEIEKAHQMGYNAVSIAVLWDFVKVYRANTPNPWIQIDNQMKKIKSLGMKVCVRIWVNGWCGDNAGQWCSGFDPNEIMTSGDFKYDFSQGGTGKRSMTSFASNSTLTRMKNFTFEVLERYKKYQEDGDILYVSLANTGEQELGYPTGSLGIRGLFDYSPPTVEAYRVWLRRKYCNDLENLKAAWGESYDGLKSFNEINPKYSIYYQFSFDGADGKDWFIFRNYLLKRFSTEFIQTVKSVKVTRPFKIINDYGSVFDDISVSRGTMTFQDIGQGTDGIKVNNGPNYNHRFAMDLIRSNMPNKWIMNEAEVQEVLPNQSESVAYASATFQQIDQSFQHGAKMVSVFTGMSLPETMINTTKVIEVASKKWLNNPLPIQVSSSGRTINKVSELLQDGGCFQGAGGCKIISNWQEIFSKNGGKPVEVILEEDLLKGSNITCDNNDTNSDYEGILQKVDCQGGYGWIADKSSIAKNVKYEVQLDGKILKSGIADSLNQDSPRYLNNQKHGFTFKLPVLTDGVHSLKIKIPSSSFLINNAKINLSCSNSGKQTQITVFTICPDCVELNLYPNPAEERISLGFKLIDFKSILVEIFDILGRRIYTLDSYGLSGDNDLEINLKGYPSGTYLMNIKIDQKYYQRKFVKR